MQKRAAHPKAVFFYLSYIKNVIVINIRIRGFLLLLADSRYYEIPIEQKLLKRSISVQQPPFPMPPEQQPSSSPSSTPPEQQQPLASYPSIQGQQQPGYPPYPGQSGFPGYGFQSPETRSSGNIALKYGLIFGAIAIVVNILQITINRIAFPIFFNAFHASENALSLNIYSITLSIVFAVFYWIVYFFLGFLVGRRTQRVGDTSIAALWTSLCYFVIYCLVVVFSIIPILHTIGLNLGLVLSSLISGVAFVLIVNIGLGIGICALGGLLGKNLTHK